jgi:hypothetical protein
MFFSNTTSNEEFLPMFFPSPKEIIALDKVVMANAPTELLAVADIIAPPASQQGIIQGLAEAIKRLAHKRGESHG